MLARLAPIPPRKRARSTEANAAALPDTARKGWPNAFGSRGFRRLAPAPARASSPLARAAFAPCASGRQWLAEVHPGRAAEAVSRLLSGSGSVAAVVRETVRVGYEQRSRGTRRSRVQAEGFSKTGPLPGFWPPREVEVDLVDIICAAAMPQDCRGRTVSRN